MIVNEIVVPGITVYYDADGRPVRTTPNTIEASPRALRDRVRAEVPAIARRVRDHRKADRRANVAELATRVADLERAVLHLAVLAGLDVVDLD